MAAQLLPGVTELLQRSHRLGPDPRDTNYAGGNTSAKGEVTDPVTGEPAGGCWTGWARDARRVSSGRRP